MMDKINRLDIEQLAWLLKDAQEAGGSAELRTFLVENSSAIYAEIATLRDALAFQDRVQPWMMECFGKMIAGDKEERNHRFLEEALELVQACETSRSECHQLVDYVYGRAVGEKAQEVGGVMVTLAALCLAQELDMHDAGEVELARVWTKIDRIRAKQAAKPKHGPLPEDKGQGDAGC